MPNSGVTSLAASPNLSAAIVRPVITHDPSVTDITNPAVKQVAQDVLHALLYSLTGVAAKPEMEVRPNSAEADFKLGLKTVAPALKERLTANAIGVLKAPADSLKPLFGRFAALPVDAVVRQGFDRAPEALPALKIDPKLFGFGQPSITVPLSDLRATNEGLLLPRAVLPQTFEEFEGVVKEGAEERLRSSVLDRDVFESVWGKIQAGDSFEEGQRSEFEAEAVTDKLALYVRRIKCEDETNPEWWGNDEIALAGLSTDEDGEVKKIGETYIGGGFSDGTQKTYSNWVYHSFSMRERNYWPKKFGVTLILAEKDNGGLSTFLNTVWQKIKDQVLAALKAAANAAGVALATFLGIPEFGIVIGKVIGEAVAWVVNKLVDWLISLFQDDIFAPFTAWCTVPSMGARWSHPNGTWGNPWSPVNWVRYSGFGGRYLLEYQWRIYA